MNFVLVKFGKVKLLIDEECSIEPLVESLDAIIALSDKTSKICRNILVADSAEVAELTGQAKVLQDKIGYKIIGFPFTFNDAELYALTHQIEYTELLIAYGN